MYDTAIIGTGPAGLSAALNLRLHNKSIIWLGTGKTSLKISLAEKIANYPGLPMISGAELNAAMLRQAEEMDLSITEGLVTDIMRMNGSFMLLAGNEMYEAKSIVLAVGSVPAKGIEGEDRLLGSGVSYCATCDGFLYKGKTVAVYCADKQYEHEVKYLAELAERVYFYAAYDGTGIELPNVTLLGSRMIKVNGDHRVTGITLADKAELAADGVFFLRSSVSPSLLFKGIATEGAHITVDRSMATNISGVFAAGDCTGRPYQIAKAVGEGNVAAHSVLGYLDAGEARGSDR